MSPEQRLAQPISDAEADELLEAAFPFGLPSQGRSSKPPVQVIETFPLEVSHLATLAAHIESGASLGVEAGAIKRIRPTHHRAARLLATGLDETKVALLCNYTPARISILKSDPAFQELLTAYSGEVDDTWADTVQVMADLSMDALQELQIRLEETPEMFNIVQLQDLVKLTADRSGNGPTSTQNVNAKVMHMTPADLERIKHGSGHSGNVAGPSTVRPLTANDRRAIAGQAVDAAPASGQVESDQLVLPFGDAVREAGPESA